MHEHHARRLHWDLRLEMEGVLRSWAVPKGPTLDPRDKRLAVLVEDHPVAYGEFEGTIPEGEYGAGTVMIWDRGTYEAADGRDPADAFREGRLVLVFRGRRMRGRFYLIRTGRPGPKAWLLYKGKDEFARSPYGPTAQVSIATGRTINEIRGGGTARTRR